ncbi:S-layer homology domain-containing protein [Candidatus Peregrinibacteria bacterium]|nr:S-layer homology domain-containing protein [Candidatus Peregrinibacteria bacterium]
MLKKLTLAFIFTFAFIASANAEEINNPTVKITSYKNLLTEQILGIGSGSGTLISSNGLVISNSHVIYDEDEQKPLDTFEVCITFSVEEEPECIYTARLVAYDKDMDISILKINPKDVLGKPLPNLKYLDYQTNTAPKEGDEVQIMGYPGSGGNTITITKGQISGFDKFNDYTYFKTDTDFDHGSSGGTAYDSAGNYIGIPTYIRSYAENVGYFLDVRQAVSWIKANINKSASTNIKAENRLKLELERLKKANDEMKYAYKEYPNLSIEIPKGWKFYSIEDDGLYTEQEKLTEPAALGVYLNFYQYKIDEGYMEKLDEELAKIKDSYPDYKQTKIKFNGYDAYKITYTYYNIKQNSIYIPYGYVLAGVSYGINIDEEEKQKKAIEEVLSSIRLSGDKINYPNLSSTISFNDPGFSLTMPNGWRIQENKSNQPRSLLAEAVQENNFDGYINIYYSQTPKDEKELETKDRLDEKTEYISKLITKKDDVVLDGLKGFLYTNEYEGDDYQEMKKMLSLTLKNEDYEFTIVYEDLSENFDKNIPDIEKILNSFTFTGRDLEEKGVYDFGTLSNTFSDVQYHRFESAIADLADKGIIKGYEDGTFKPENLINRSEALKIILESKNYLDEKKGLGKEINFSGYTTNGKIFSDVSANEWFDNYVAYANEVKIVSGYADGTFKPEQTVNLVEALKIVFGVYEIPLWKGETTPWYKVYMDKGYELGLIGRGLENPDQKLTRAELADIVNDVYNNAANSYSYY